MLQYEGKRVRGPNGEVGEIRDGQLVILSGAPPQDAGGLREIVPPRPKQPTPQTPEQRTGTLLNNEGQNLQNTNTAQQPVYNRFNAVDKLRDNIRNDKRIQSYEGALPIWASALKAPETPEGDTMLVNAYAKTLDPTTGVQQREGDA